MRKITKSIAAAFVAGLPKSDGATRTDGQAVYLHGNCIARKVASLGGSGRARLEINWCGWVTATTAERINGILAAYGSAFRVGRKQGKPIAWANGKDSAMPSNGFVPVTDCM